MKSKVLFMVMGAMAGTSLGWTKQAAVYSTDGSQTDVVAAVANATAGDTIKIPAGTFTWGASRTSISLNKPVTLQGAGPDATTIVLSESGPTYGTGVVLLSAAAVVRDFSIQGSTGTVTAFACYAANGWRVTNIHYDGGSGSGYFLYAESFGLIDHCSITGSNGSAEYVFTRGPTNAWQTPSSMGTADAVYIEDCVYDGQGYVSDANSNSRMVVRHCTIKGSNKVDAHGVASNSPPRSCRQIEVYGNSWTATGGYFADLEIRGGTGMLFDNTDQNPQGGWFFLSEYGYLGKWPNFGSVYQTPANYPVADQIGVGMDPKVGGSEPLYSWNNSRLGAPWGRTIRAVDAGAITAYGRDFTETDLIAPDRDYFWSVPTFDGSSGIGRGTKAEMQSIFPAKPGVGFWVTDEGDWDATHPGPDGRLYAWNGTAWAVKYTPYTYPHPLRGAGSASTKGGAFHSGSVVARWERDELWVICDRPADLRIEVFSVAGRAVRNVLRDGLTPGEHRIALGTGLQPGIYLARTTVSGRPASLDRLLVQ